ncbi:hypothetical protein [Pseudonocardia sp. TRM90224]|uniref:hypothetical protein n=1 Tax=Pseudonocardia sp. TRM90224 TaxID=2812678 RepID=UPI001E487988|nr:hypothetical protein [Pseudonocardia sp. TRM90224]
MNANLIGRVLAIVGLLAAMQLTGPAVANAAVPATPAAPAGLCVFGHNDNGSCRGSGLLNRSVTRGVVTVNCSVGSCSFYLSRAATKNLHEREGDGAALLRYLKDEVCHPLQENKPTAAAGALCALAVAKPAVETYVLRDNIRRAATEHGKKGACLKITVPHAPPILYISTNNGKYCKK